MCDYDIDFDYDYGDYDAESDTGQDFDVDSDYEIPEVDVDLDSATDTADDTSTDSLPDSVDTDVELESAEEVYDSEPDNEPELPQDLDEIVEEFEVLEEEEEELDEIKEDPDTDTDKVEFKPQDSPPELKQETKFDYRLNERDSFIPRYNYSKGSKAQLGNEIDRGVDFQKEADPENRFPFRLPRDPSDLLIGGNSSRREIITPEIRELYGRVTRDSARSGLRSIGEGIRAMFRLVEAGVKSVSWLAQQLNSVLDDSIDDTRIREYERLLEMHHRLQEKFNPRR